MDINRAANAFAGLLDIRARGTSLCRAAGYSGVGEEGEGRLHCSLATNRDAAVDRNSPLLKTINMFGTCSKMTVRNHLEAGFFKISLQSCWL